MDPKTPAPEEDRRAAVLATCIRPVGRRGHLAMVRESILASVRRRDVLANEAADRSFEPDALAQATGRSRRRRTVGRDDRSGQTCKRHQNFGPEADDCRYGGDGEGDCVLSSIRSNSPRRNSSPIKDSFFVGPTTCQIESRLIQMQRVAKTDHIDATTLAEFAAVLAQRPDYERFVRPLSDPAQQNLAALVTRRCQLVVMRLSERQRLRLARPVTRPSIQALLDAISCQSEVGGASPAGAPGPSTLPSLPAWY